MTAQMIRRWTYVGEYTEVKLIQTRDTLNRAMLDEMRDEGYIPLLDVNPVWATTYLGGERFQYKLTMQGVHVGKERAWDYQGMMDGKLVPSAKKSR